MLGLFASTLSAQRTYNNNNTDDYIYQSVASIVEDNVGSLDPGYAFAYTNVSTSFKRGEFIRTDFDGVPLIHKFYLENNNEDLRFTHIEEISDQYLAPNKQFLVVGSFETPNGNALGVALLDDMGNIVNQNHFRSEEMPNLIGIKGLYNDQSGQFCIIGMQADGFLPGDSKDIVVLGLDDDLNFDWSVKLSSPHLGEDHDFVTDIAVVGPHEYAIVGTSNDQNTSTSKPVAMTAVVDPGGVFSFNNAHLTFPSAHETGAAVLRPDPHGSDLWIMSNSYAFGGVVNSIVLKQTDYIGNIISLYQIDGNSNRILGFNLEELHGGLIGISGYKYTSANEAIPFYMRFDPSTGAIIDQREYPNNISNANITTYNANDLLNMTAFQSTLPYFYNEISTIRGDYNGVVFTANDETFSLGGFALRAYGVDETGIYTNNNTTCGLIVNSAYPSAVATNAIMPNLTFDFAFVSEEGDFMSETTSTIGDDDCGPLYKTNSTSNEANLNPSALSIYPNPSEGTFTIGGYRNATSLVVHDMAGRIIMEQDVTGDETKLALASAENGTYLVKVMKGETVIATERIQVNK